MYVMETSLREKKEHNAQAHAAERAVVKLVVRQEVTSKSRSVPR
jgi:hypothetical protein